MTDQNYMKQQHLIKTNAINSSSSSSSSHGSSDSHSAIHGSNTMPLMSSMEMMSGIIKSTSTGGIGSIYVDASSHTEAAVSAHHLLSSLQCRAPSAPPFTFTDSIFTRIPSQSYSSVSSSTIPTSIPSSIPNSIPNSIPTNATGIPFGTNVGTVTAAFNTADTPCLPRTHHHTRGSSGVSLAVSSSLSSSSPLPQSLPPPSLSRAKSLTYKQPRPLHPHGKHNSYTQLHLQQQHMLQHRQSPPLAPFALPRYNHLRLDIPYNDRESSSSIHSLNASTAVATSPVINTVNGHTSEPLRDISPPSSPPYSGLSLSHTHPQLHQHDPHEPQPSNYHQQTQKLQTQFPLALSPNGIGSGSLKPSQHSDGATVDVNASQMPTPIHSSHPSRSSTLVWIPAGPAIPHRKWKRSELKLLNSLVAQATVNCHSTPIVSGATIDSSIRTTPLTASSTTMNFSDDSIDTIAASDTATTASTGPTIDSTAEILSEQWDLIALHIGTRTAAECRQQWSADQTLTRHGKWSKDEDTRLMQAYADSMDMTYASDLSSSNGNTNGGHADSNANGYYNGGCSGSVPRTAAFWNRISSIIGGRTGQQCMARYNEALDPSVIKGKWSSAEDVLLRKGVSEHGKVWVRVAENIPGRTQRQCRTRWMMFRKTEASRRAAAVAAPTAATESRSHRTENGGVHGPDHAITTMKRLHHVDGVTLALSTTTSVQNRDALSAHPSQLAPGVSDVSSGAYHGEGPADISGHMDYKHLLFTKDIGIVGHDELAVSSCLPDGRCCLKPELSSVDESRSTSLHDCDRVPSTGNVALLSAGCSDDIDEDEDDAEEEDDDEDDDEDEDGEESEECGPQPLSDGP